MIVESTTRPLTEAAMPLLMPGASTTNGSLARSGRMPAIQHGRIYGASLVCRTVEAIGSPECPGVVGELVPAAMPQDVAGNQEREAGRNPGARHHALVAGHTQWSEAFGYIDVDRPLALGRLTLQATQGRSSSHDVKHLHRCPRTAVAGKAEPRLEGAGLCRSTVMLRVPCRGRVRAFNAPSAAAFGASKK
jgi:hypothetical protein